LTGYSLGAQEDCQERTNRLTAIKKTALPSREARDGFSARMHQASGQENNPENPVNPVQKLFFSFFV